MIAISADVVGEKELMRKFGELDRRIQSRSLGRALKAGGKPVQQAARATAPVDTGAMKRSITLRRAKRQKRGVVAYTVFAKGSKIAKISGTTRVKGKSSGYYPAYLEYGTKRMQKRPWLGPAFDSRISVVKSEIARVLKEEIEAASK